jgi:isopentenyl-diphosphate delta-isomerase type 1
MFALILVRRRANVAGFAPLQRIRPGHQHHPQPLNKLAVRHMTSDYGEGMDQEAMMESDMLVVVDENDVLVPNAVVSKKKAHEFNNDQPRGIAHRAFSIFIFNEKNEMLLTRRADSKITFPGVWTNTCCSHPCHGMTPNEVDVVPDAFPDFPGIKHAAIRKLRHELGIDSKYVPHDDIQFVSRFHYWAADTKTYGAETPWGEHEVDYVLFLQNKGEQPEIRPNEDEVAEYKYVSIDELKLMFDEPELEWSPWFRGIMDLGGFEWWQDLEATLKGEHCYSDVTFFDPPLEHYGNYNLASHGRLTGVLSSTEAEVKSN